MKRKTEIFRNFILLFSILLSFTFAESEQNSTSIEDNTTTNNSNNTPKTSSIWWNNNYSYRKAISIDNSYNYAINDAYTFTFTINTFALITNNKLQENGDDLRIIWSDPDTLILYELDRYNLTRFNTINTKIAFRIQQDIAAFSESNDYYIYYGNINSGTPFSNPNNIFLDYDNFDEPDGDASKWTIIEGNGWNIESNQYINNEIDLEFTLLNNLYLADVSIQVNLQATSSDFGLGIIARYINVNKFYYAGLGVLGWKTSFGRQESKGLSNILSDGHSETELLPNQWYTLRFEAIGNRFLIYLDDSLMLDQTDVEITQYGSIGLVAEGDSTSIFENYIVMQKNENDPEYTIEIEEIFATQIIELLEINDPLEFGENFSVQVELNDVAGINQSLFKINNINYPMTQINTNIWNYSNFKPNYIGVYDYEIHIQNNNNEWKIIQNNFTVVDSIAPNIQNLSIEKSPLNLGDYQIIEVDCIDESQISDVFLEFNNINHSMNLNGVNHWNYSLWTPDSWGFANFNIYAIDNENNIGYQSGSFEIIDDIGPVISNVIVNDENIQLFHNQSFLTEISDYGSGVDLVIIELNNINYSMINIGSDLYELSDWNATTIGLVDFIIYAYDVMGNINNYEGNFSVTDISKPLISNTLLNNNPIENGDLIIINVNVSDEVYDISNVYIELLGNEYLMNEISMNNYSFSTTINTDFVGNIYYSIKANNSNNIWSQKSYSVTIIDTVKPVMLSSTFDYEIIEYGNYQNLSIEIYDETGIKSVIMEYNDKKYTLLNNYLNNYSISWIPDHIGQEEILLFTEDVAGNILTTYLQFITNDTISPLLEDLSISLPLVEFGELYSIQVKATDLAGIDNVYLNLENKEYTLTETLSSIWTVHNVYPNNSGTINFTIFAQDSNGNSQNMTGSINFYDDTIPTIIGYENTVDIIELGENLFIDFYAYDNWGISNCIFIENNESYQMNKLGLNYWYFDEWNPNEVNTFNFSIEIIDFNDNKYIINDSIIIQDTTSPSSPVFLNSPTGEISGTVFFDWDDGFDASGIAYYILIIDNESNIFATPGYVYEITIYNNGSETSFYELDTEILPGNYYYYLYQVDNTNHLSAATMGSFQVIENIIDIDPNTGNSDENTDIPSSKIPNFVIYISAIIGLVSISVISYTRMHHHSNHKFATITDLGLKNSINELKIIKTESIISHLNKVDIANLFSVEEAKLRTISIKTQASKEMHSSISNDLVEIQKKIKNIELIFSQGAYFEAILQYNNISEEFLKIGHLESALLYKKLANNILEISRKRDQLVLEFEESFSKLNYQVKKIEDLKTFFKLELIIDLSQKINDRETVKEFEDIFISLNEDELH